MTHHVDNIAGLLAEPQTFYKKRWLGETGAYALEWINAFAHLPPELRAGLLVHGGTAAQLVLGDQQRFSRDVDLIGTARGRIESVLDAIAKRYEDRLFQWEETAVEDPPIALQRFSAYFKTAAGENIPLMIDVIYLSVELDTAPLRLAQSGIYVPHNPEDAIETLTSQALIADKLPTLGFDTLGYGRGAGVLGNPDHVWKQLHDITRLITASGSLDRIPELYERSVAARNTARGLTHSPDACLNDAYRVAMIALAAAMYPNNDDRPGDANYASDVDHVREGRGRFAQHLTKTATPYDDSTTTALLASGLLAVRAGEATASELQGVFVQLRELAVAFNGSAPLRDALRARFDNPANPDGWGAPVSSRQLYRLRPYAAMTAWVAANVTTELRQRATAGRFSFESP